MGKNDFYKLLIEKMLEFIFYIEKMELETDIRSIESIYNSLNEEVPELVKRICDNYRYVGKTAVNIFEEESIFNEVTKEQFIQVLQKELGADEIFDKEFRPPLHEKPQINYVEDRGQSILIRFVMKGKARNIRDGYDIRQVASSEFEVAIVHFENEGRVLVELRCSYSKRAKFLACFEQYFQNATGRQGIDFDWKPITKVSNKEAEEIAKRLSAGLVEADHKDSGIYDRHVVTASPHIKDLRDQEEYITEFKNKMLLSQVLTIDYTEETDYGEYKTEIKFKINLNTGFQFLSKVNEGVVEYVMKVFREVRYGIS